MLRAADEPTPPPPEEVPFAPRVPLAVMREFANVIPSRPDDARDLRVGLIAAHEDADHPAQQARAHSGEDRTADGP